MSFHTVQDGQQALIFSHGGSGRLVVGPRRVSGILEEDGASWKCRGRYQAEEGL